MHPDDKRKLAAWALLLSPIFGWFFAVKINYSLAKPAIKSLWFLVKDTPNRPVLWAGLAIGLGVGILLAWLINSLGDSAFGGQKFRRRLRGSVMVTADKLKKITQEKDEQVSVAGFPMPTRVEGLHLLITGSTGAGKTVLIRELFYSAKLRGDRVCVLDPNGELYSKFARDGDVLLNPYDNRTQGWSFFNEIRNEYDFKRYTLSIIPKAKDAGAEEWRSYARLLFQETARKLSMIGTPSMEELFRWTTIADPKDLKKFLAGTAAESMFVGADKALASARFVLSEFLPEHLTMPKGSFSIRAWLEDPKGGDLYITWREDQAPALKPLISAWTDVFCTSILSLPESRTRRMWLFMDELASLYKLPTLMDALTKGRKHGLRVVAGLQTVAQLNLIYGDDEAQALRASFRSLVVMGGAHTDPETCEEMSKSLGEHEVERDSFSRSRNSKGTNRTTSLQTVRERVVMPTEISGLPELNAYVAFAGDHPIARTKLEILQFKTRYDPFIERSRVSA
jgi:hypothetical protein